MSWWRGTSPIRSDRRFRFDATCEEVWASLVEVDRYRGWWPWLRQFDGKEFAAGAVWRCRVQPPVPYSVRFTVTIDEVAPTSRVAATIGGDIAGTAALSLADVDAVGHRCELRLVSTLAPCRPALRALSVVGRPVIRHGHDWVLDTGATQFARAAPGVQGGDAAGR